MEVTMKKYFISLILLLAVFSVMGQNFSRPGAEQLRSMTVHADVTQGDELSNKIDPLLKLAVNKILILGKKRDYSRDLLTGLNKHIRLNENVLAELSFPVFIKSLNTENTSAIIRSSGGIVYSVLEDIIIAEVPVSFTLIINSLPEIVYVQGSYINEPMINVSVTETKVKQLHDGTGLPRSYKGKNVIVGVIDSGIDWKHADFKNGSGSRILNLWDMSGQGNPPSGYNYGTEYSRNQLNANQSTQTDGNDGRGHGTHVTGTAAGSGGANLLYTGMAPESDIIFVKGFRNSPSFSDVDVVNGCNYIFQKAAQLQKPAVINLSLGGNYGPHDGTSLYEQALNNLTGPGRIIVAAAGNSGEQNIHLGYSASGSSFNDAFETIWLVPENASASYVNLWYNTGNLSVGIAAYDKNNEQLIGFTIPVAPGQQMQAQPFTVNGFTYGWITIDATNTNDPNNQGKEILVAIESNNQVNIGDVYWSLYTFGSGTFDAWNLGGEFSTFSNNWFKPGDNKKTIGVPATAGKIICVGSYVTKNSWIDKNGNNQFQPGNPVIGNISSFSSIGPTRDNRLKPDIVAPGEVIIAALSGDYTNVPVQWVFSGGKHQKMEGTSMAAPHVSGTIALMLEKNPTLNYEQVITILKNTASRDNFTGNQPGNVFGYGKLNAYSAFQNVSGGGGQVTILQEGFDNVFTPAGWTTAVTNSNFTWKQGNLDNNNFNQIDPSSLFSAGCPWVNQDQNEWLITPSFSLGSGEAEVEFYIGHSTQWLSSATVYLRITTDNGASWTTLWSAENDGQPWSWRKININLTSYSNKSGLKLAWNYLGNDGDYIALDGVKLTGFEFATSLEEVPVSAAPAEYLLHQNYPNPFNPATIIRFDIPEHSEVSLKIYDLLGNEVISLINEEKPAGVYEVSFEASYLSSGVYFYHIRAGAYTMIRKMMLIK
jgi:minor extracellular serine protease Vpr